MNMITNVAAQGLARARAEMTAQGGREEAGVIGHAARLPAA
jgi:hypothetical protein